MSASSFRNRDVATLAQQVQESGIPTLGNRVERTVFVPVDRQGAFVGNGTEVNVAAGQFKTKEEVPITAEWAQILNVLRAQGQENDSPYNFREDPDARISITKGSGTTYVPGSRAQVDSKSSAGLASVRNPANTYKMGSKLNTNRRGQFIRVGGKTYRDVIDSAINGNLAISRQAVEQLIRQGYMYGLAPLFNQMGMVANDDYSISNMERFDPIPIQRFYDQYLKNPDQQKLGRFASASAARNHASLGHIVNPATGQVMDPVEIVQRYERSGSAKGFGWDAAHKSSKSRAGLTSHPLRRADGTAIQGPVMDPNAGECNIYGSGPGMGGNGQDEFQLNLSKQQRAHRGKGGRNFAGRASEERTVGAPTYYCGPTRADVINPDRAIYQPGGARGGDVGLGNALNQIADQMNRVDINRNALDARYTKWSNGDSFAPQFRVPNDIPGRDGKGGFALFQGARVGRNQGRAMSDQFAAQRGNAFIPAQYKGAAPPAQPFAPASSAPAASAAVQRSPRRSGRLANK